MYWRKCGGGLTTWKYVSLLKWQLISCRNENSSILINLITLIVTCWKPTLFTYRYHLICLLRSGSKNIRNQMVFWTRIFKNCSSENKNRRKWHIFIFKNSPSENKNRRKWHILIFKNSPGEKRKCRKWGILIFLSFGCYQISCCSKVHTIARAYLGGPRVAVTPVRKGVINNWKNLVAAIKKW